MNYSIIPKSRQCCIRRNIGKTVKISGKISYYGVRIMKTKPKFHGSDLEAVEAYYHIPKEEIVCFSANVNPLGLSENVKKELAAHLDILSTYPDREYTSLRKAIAGYCQVDPAHIVVGNGSTELISLLIQTRKARKALIVGPTYSEYERELSLVGGTLTYYHLREEDLFRMDITDFISVLSDGYDLVILCNPNNPTSSALTTEEISQILDACKETGCFMMIDETYAEFAPDIQAVTAMSLTGIYDNLMVLRGVSKFFAAPGLRLGYGVTSSAQFLSSLKLLQNPWSLNSLGAFAGERMLKDTDYIQRTRNLIQTERTRLVKELSDFEGIKVYPAYANFVLIRILKPGLSSSQVFDYLIEKRMMIRDCSSFQCLDGEYIRFCIMLPDDNTRLLNALGELLKRHRAV